MRIYKRLLTQSPSGLSGFGPLNLQNKSMRSIRSIGFRVFLPNFWQPQSRTDSQFAELCFALCVPRLLLKNKVMTFASALISNPKIYVWKSRVLNLTLNLELNHYL